MKCKIKRVNGCRAGMATAGPEAMIPANATEERNHTMMELSRNTESGLKRVRPVAGREKADGGGRPAEWPRGCGKSGRREASRGAWEWSGGRVRGWSGGGAGPGLRAALGRAKHWRARGQYRRAGRSPPKRDRRPSDAAGGGERPTVRHRAGADAETVTDGPGGAAGAVFALPLTAPNAALLRTFAERERKSFVYFRRGRRRNVKKEHPKKTRFWTAEFG